MAEHFDLTQPDLESEQGLNITEAGEDNFPYSVDEEGGIRY